MLASCKPFHVAKDHGDEFQGQFNDLLDERAGVQGLYGCVRTMVGIRAEV